MERKYSTEIMTNELDIIFDEFRQSIKIDEKAISKREEKLKAELNERFGEKCSIILAKSILRNSLNYAVTYYLTGRFAMVYIELYAVLERTAILVLPQLLSGPKHIAMHTKERYAIETSLRRQTIKDFIPLFKIIEVWDKDDEIQVKKLIQKRNGIAHHNPEIISKQFNSGKYINSASINKVVEKDIKTHKVIVDTVELIYKIISS